MVPIGDAEYLGGGDVRFYNKEPLAFSPDRVMFGDSQVTAMADVACIEIVGDQQAKSKIGATVVFGVMGGLAAKGAVDRTEIGIHLKSGAIPYFRLLKQNRTQVRALLVPILREAKVPFLDEVIAEPQQAAPSPMDEIQKAFELLKVGALTQQEFDDAKKRLLGNAD